MRVNYYAYHGDPETYIILEEGPVALSPLTDQDKRELSFKYNVPTSVFDYPVPYYEPFQEMETTNG